MPKPKFSQPNRHDHGPIRIEIDLEKPTPSAFGKTLVVASTRGNTVTTAEVDGKPITIGLNAYIKP
jgi:hypothetical protein